MGGTDLGTDDKMKVSRASAALRLDSGPTLVPRFVPESPQYSTLVST